MYSLSNIHSLRTIDFQFKYLPATFRFSNVKKKKKEKERKKEDKMTGNVFVKSLMFSRVPTGTGKPGKMGEHFPVREF